MCQKIELLSDAQVQRFIVDGWLNLSLDELGSDFHAGIYRMANERRPSGSLSEEIDSQIPELRAVLESPTVRGALQGILGSGYIRHPHTGAYVQDIEYISQESPPNFEQGWHRDSYWGVQRVHHHRPRWLICMYYPVTVRLDMGPTAIAPGSQYYSLPGDGDGRAQPPPQPIRHDQLDDPECLMEGDDLSARDRLLQATLASLDPELKESPIVVEAGSFCCFHYDLYHRRLRRLSMYDGTVPPRVMFKFLFTSGHHRTTPSWAHEEGDPEWNKGPTNPDRRLLWQSIWTSMLGSSSVDSACTDEHIPAEKSIARTREIALESNSEIARMGAAYQLGQDGCGGNTGAVQALIEVLQHGCDSARRAAMHGLGAAGPAAVDPLLAVLSRAHTDYYASCGAVHALGEAVEVPTVVMVEVIASLMKRVAQVIEKESRLAGGWPAGGGGHPPPSGFPNKSPNPKERQAWPPKLLHATCLQALGLMAQRASVSGNNAVVQAVIEQFVTCLGRPEPGGGNPDYPPDSTLGSGCMSRQNAALGLRILGASLPRGIDKRMQQTVIEACRRASQDRDIFVAHYSRDALCDMLVPKGEGGLQSGN